MRKLSYSAQTTLNNRIANTDGTFWEPFAWGDPEQAFINRYYAEADTWVVTRPMFEAIVPWWTEVAEGRIPDDVAAVSPVDLEFARIFAGLDIVAISRTMTATDEQRVISGDLASELRALKEQPGRDIVLSAGPATLAPLLAEAGLIDELVLVIHPAIIGSGPRLFEDADLTLRLIEATVFEAGAIVVRYSLAEQSG